MLTPEQLEELRREISDGIRRRFPGVDFRIRRTQNGKLVVEAEPTRRGGKPFEEWVFPDEFDWLPHKSRENQIERVYRQLGFYVKKVWASCEQRSYLPGDAEVGLQPKGCNEPIHDPSPSTCECRRSWASSAIPDTRGDSNATPASALPGDTERIDNLTLKMNNISARMVRAYNNSTTEYRWDPKHHNRPPAGAWRRTDAGWSRIPATEVENKSASAILEVARELLKEQA